MHFVVVATVIKGLASDTLLVFQAAEDHGSAESCDWHLIVAQGNYIYRSLHLLISWLGTAVVQELDDLDVIVLMLNWYRFFDRFFNNMWQGLLDLLLLNELLLFLPDWGLHIFQSDTSRCYVRLVSFGWRTLVGSFARWTEEKLLGHVQILTFRLYLLLFVSLINLLNLDNFLLSSLSNTSEQDCFIVLSSFTPLLIIILILFLFIGVFIRWCPIILLHWNILFSCLLIYLLWLLIGRLIVWWILINRLSHGEVSRHVSHLIILIWLWGRDVVFPPSDCSFPWADP